MSARGWLAVALMLFAPLAGATCTLQTPMIALGTYDPLNPAPPPVLVAIQATCTESTAISVSAGKGSSGSFAERTVRMGVEAVRYNLFIGTTDTTIWGDGTPATGVVAQIVNPDEVVQLVGNARIYPGQSPLPGFYSDTLIFTATF